MMLAPLGSRFAARSWPLVPRARLGAVTLRRGFGAQSGADDATLEELREKIAETKSQIEELVAKRVQVKQDTQQAAKRHETDLSNESKYGITKLARVFLQIPDNLERAVSSVPQEVLANDEELREMSAGVKKMQKVVDKALHKFGVEKMKAEGEVFDPQKHEAMFAMPMPDKEPNTIFHVMEPGYDIHDRTLRAAKVGVVRA